MTKIRFLLLTLIFPFLLISQHNYTDFSSEKIRFSYPNTYTISENRILMDVNVKLISNDIGSDGKKDQIGINLNSMYSSFNEIKKEEVIKGMKEEIEQGGEELGIDVKFTSLSYDSEIIDGKKIISMVSKTEFLEYNVVQNQMMYIYIENGKSCFISLSSGTLQELYDKKKDVDYILKTLMVL